MEIRPRPFRAHGASPLDSRQVDLGALLPTLFRLAVSNQLGAFLAWPLKGARAILGRKDSDIRLGDRRIGFLPESLAASYRRLHR